MKKKRKKKATSPCSLLLSPSRNFSRTTSRWRPSLGSVPDVPNMIAPSCGLSGCLEFLDKLFGNKVWHESPDGVTLRNFSRQLTDKIVVHWDTVHIDDCLYVHVPNKVSKESFVALLDYAEEVLGVMYVITCIDVDICDFKNLVKSFRFMGFDHILPHDPLVCFNEKHDKVANRKWFHFLGYEM